MNRRSLIVGLSGLIAAPAVLRLGAHMPVRRVDRSRTWYAATRPCGLGDGSSWQNAAPFWRAMANAKAGDVVMLSEVSGAEMAYPSLIFERTAQDIYRQTRTYNVIGGHNA